MSSILAILALLIAPACGGGGGSDSGTGGSPGPLSASFVPDQPAPGANAVALLEGPKANDIVNVYVTLTDTNGTLGTALEAVYDDARATYLGYARGAAYEQGGNAPNYTVTSHPGRVLAAVVRSNGTTTNVIGTKAVLTLQFRVKQVGTSAMTIENGAVYDGQNVPQPIAGISWYGGALRGE
jgi:hypothetical protein